MASIDTLICPTDCSAELPLFAFSQCNPTLLQSQIDHIYLGNIGYPFTDWTNPAEWAARLILTTEANAIRDLTVLGALADPTSTIKKISGQRTVNSPQTFVLTADVDDNSDTNYDAARATGCNRQYAMWYSILGGRLYGGNSGIQANVRMWEPITVNDEDYVTLKLSLQWTSQFMPLRIVNPIA